MCRVPRENNVEAVKTVREQLKVTPDQQQTLRIGYADRTRGGDECLLLADVDHRAICQSATGRGGVPRGASSVGANAEDVWAGKQKRSV
jgi:hypothetical protein